MYRCETCREWVFDTARARHQCPPTWFGIVKCSHPVKGDEWSHPYEVRAHDGEDAAEKIGESYDDGDPYLAAKPESASIEVVVCRNEDGSGKRETYCVHARIDVSYVVHAAPSPTGTDAGLDAGDRT